MVRGRREYVGVSQIVSAVLMLLIKFMYDVLCVVLHPHLFLYFVCGVASTSVPLLSRSMIFAAADCLSVT